MAFMQFGQIMQNRSIKLQQEFGMPQPMTGAFLAPFDAVADVMRGLNGTILDMFRQPDKLSDACEALVGEMVNFGMALADPFKRYPIFVPTHKATFLSPDQFDTFYWPTFKRTMETLIDNGYRIRAYLEGDWGHYWRHMLELPKGTVVCDIDNQGDIFKAIDDIGHHQCVVGGMPDSLLILGSTKEVRERVKMLCDAAGRDKSLIINGGCAIPYDTKPQNYRAMIEAILEFATYDTSLKPVPEVMDVASGESQTFQPKMVTDWSKKREELGDLPGDELLIKRNWERLEVLAYAWLWQWLM
jgi:uroporphyrinogen-III decarboxylase